jgi:two-component system cell cycle sensor histidine kinase/response regulator CckA
VTVTTIVAFDLGDAVLLLLLAVSVAFVVYRARRDASRLRHSEQLYRALVEKLPVGLYLDKPDGSAANLYSNPALVEMFGYAAERWHEPEFFASILHPDDHAHVIGIGTVSDDPFEETYRLRASDGTWRWVVDRGVLISDDSGCPLHVQGVLFDITAQKELEGAAIVASRRYRSLVENMPLVTYVEDARAVGTTVYISPQIETLLGYPAERWLAEKDFFFKVLDPAFHEQINAARGDGRTTQEFRVFAADGSERWIHSERITVFDVDGEPMFVQGLWVDLTEKRQLEARLAQQDRLEAVGQLAAGIAHNFNNMLVAIRGYAELGARRQSLGEVGRDLGVIVDTAERAADLVRHLMAFSGRQMLAPRPTDMRAVIDDLRDMLSQLLGSQIRIEIDARPGAFIAHVDRAHIEQALVNLAINARDAMPDGGTLTISLHEVFDGEGHGGAVISVTDTGTGIDPEHADRIFDPFFTTKATGTGLGLATAHGTISQSGGQLRLAQTSPGGGTTFEIYLPQPEAELAAAAG